MFTPQVVNFNDIFPEAEESPTQIPENLMPKNCANLRTLLSSSLTAGSRCLYQRAWIIFSPILSLILRLWWSSFVGISYLFICHLTFCTLALSTTTSDLSAISYVHKLRGLHDPTKSFLMNSEAINGSQPSTASWHTFSGEKTCFTWGGSCT